MVLPNGIIVTDDGIYIMSGRASRRYAGLTATEPDIVRPIPETSPDYENIAGAALVRDEIYTSDDARSVLMVGIGKCSKQTVLSFTMLTT